MFGFKKSTVEDWLLWNRITEKEYEKIIKNGYSYTEIYRNLRDNKKNPSIIKKLLEKKEYHTHKIEKISTNETDLDREIYKCYLRLSSFLECNEKSKKTMKLLDDLKKIINVFEQRFK